VKEDDPVVEIMTDKVNTELPAPASGVLSKIIVPEGGTVHVFAAMASSTKSAPRPPISLLYQSQKPSRSSRTEVRSRSAQAGSGAHAKA